MRSALAAAAVAGAVLTGCSYSHIVGTPAASAQHAAMNAAATFTVRIPAQAKAHGRTPQYLGIAPGSIAASAQPAPGSIYAPAFTCLNVVAGQSAYTLSLAAPIGVNTFTVTANAGPCAGALPTGAVLEQAGPVVGSIVGGQSNNLNGPGFFNANPIALGAVFSPGRSSLSGSLRSSGVSGTSFAIDPGVTMAMPIALSLNDATGSPLATTDGSGNPLPINVPVQLQLVDTSGNAQAGTLAIAAVAASGAVLAGPLRTSGSPPSATLTVSSVPQTGAQYVVLYNGATQSTFQGATLTANSGTAAFSTIKLTSQSVITTCPITYPTSPGPAGIAVFGANVAVADGSQVFANTVLTGAGSGASTITAGANFSALSILSGAAQALYVTDSSCSACSSSASGIYAFAAAGSALALGDVNGKAPVQLPLASNGLQNSVGGGYPAGPVGIVGLAPAQGGATGSGSLLVAANNSIYRIDLASAVTTAGAAKLIAGSGTAGANGAGNVDNASGTNARFNFGTSKFIGLALDPTGSTLYVADNQNNSLRAVSLTGSNAVTTITSVLLPLPVGLAVDGNSRYLYATNPIINNIYQIANGNVTLFAGHGLSGTQDGLASDPYPLQFNAGNSVASAGGGSASTPFSQLGLTPNSTVAAQSPGAPQLYSAVFSGPTGIAWDPATSYFYVTDAASGAVRQVR